MVAAVAYGLAGIVLFILALAVTIHVWPKLTPGIPFLLGLWLIVAAIIAATIVLFEPDGRLALVATNLAIYLFIIEAFIFTYAVAIASLSVRLMVSMLDDAVNPDAFERALERYSAEYFLDHRLDRLVEQGLLRSDGDRYVVTPKGRSWARLASYLKSALAVGAGG